MMAHQPTEVPEVENKAVEQQAPVALFKSQPGSFLETPEVTGGDVGNQISDTGNETVLKDEDSGEITNAHGHEKEFVGVEKNVNELNEVAGDADADMVTRTGSTMLTSQEKLDAIEANNRQHHLLRHSLSPDERGTAVLSHFGVETVADAAKQIKKMSQRDLQARFKAVYGTKTFSNNNNWLRRKLFEAIGMDPGKSATKSYIGRSGINTRQFKGNLDELTIFDSPLNPSQIGSLLLP